MSDVAVIVPALNAEVWLAETLEGVLDQTHHPAEVLVAVDRGCSDQTEAVARGFEPDVRVELIGPTTSANARTLGLEATSSPLVANCDADDVWLPTKLEKQVAALEEQDVVDGVFCRVDEFVSAEVPDEIAGRLRSPMQGADGRVASALLVRRASLDRIGGFRARDHLATWIEWVSNAESTGLNFEVLPEVLVRRRLHPSSFTRRHGEDRGSLVATMRAHLNRARAGDLGEVG